MLNLSSEHYRTIGGVGLALLSVLALVYFIFSDQPASEPIDLAPTPTVTPSPTAPPMVRVYVTGAVAKADVYELPAGSIVKDAILAAGGLTAEADPERINQAVELQDQQQIHVPRRIEPTPGQPTPPPPIPPLGTATPLNQPAGLVNLNTATLAELDTLPGIGPALGQRIINYRETVGPFNSVAEITNVRGIGEAVLADIEPLATVE